MVNNDDRANYLAYIYIHKTLSALKNSKKRAHNDRLTGSTSFRALFVQLRTTFLSPRGYFTLLYRKHRMCPTNSLLCLLREILEFLQFLLCCSSNSYCFVKTFKKYKRCSLKKDQACKEFYQASDLKRPSSSVSQVDPFCANRGILLVPVSSQSRLLNLEREGGNIMKGTACSLRCFDICWP